jgi:hypothetical protein
VKLDPESAAELVWPGEAPEGETALAWEFAAKDKSGAATDRLRVTQQIAPAVPITVQQATFARVEGELEIPAAVPAGAVSGRNGPLGGIEVGSGRTDLYAAARTQALLRDVPLRLPRTENVRRHWSARRRALAASCRGDADLPRRQRPGTLLPER